MLFSEAIGWMLGQSGTPQGGRQSSVAEAQVDKRKRSTGESPARTARVYFFQGGDLNLYLRTWRAGKVKVVCPLKMGEGGGPNHGLSRYARRGLADIQEFRAGGPVGNQAPPDSVQPGTRLPSPPGIRAADRRWPKRRICAPCFTDDPEELLRLHRLKDNELHEFLKWPQTPAAVLPRGRGQGAYGCAWP